MYAPAKIMTCSARNFGSTQEQILASYEKKLKELQNTTMDLLCFPEEFLISAGDKNNPNAVANYRRVLELAKEYAAKLHTNMVVSATEEAEEYPGRHYNTAYLLDRTGNIIGKSRKRHVTPYEISADFLPGDRVQVFETDIGRIGMLTCFDVGWRDDWRVLKEKGADIVVWPSAYHGGNLLNGYAALYSYYVVTSVWNSESRIIDRMGNTIAEGNRWDPFVTAMIYPRSQLFHTDNHVRLIGDLRAEYGDELYINVDGKINMIELAVCDERCSLEEIKAKYGLVTYDEYHAMATRQNNALRAEMPEK